MIATPVVLNDGPHTGPRPINLSKDSQQVLELLDVSFGPVRGLYGQRVLSSQFSLQGSGLWPRKLTWPSQKFVPGFVWEENGRIVGNATLLQSDLFGRYIVANVAVRPEYRRRGIARGLMQQLIHYVHELQGQRIMLQVDHDNAAAIGLYKSLGFQILGTMNRWDNNVHRLRLSQDQADSTEVVRPLANHEWRAAYNLDINSMSPDLTWPTPPLPDLYKNHFWRRLSDFLNGRRFFCWVVDQAEPEKKSAKYIIGLVAIVGEWGRPNWLRLRVAQRYKGRYEQALLAVAFHKLRSMGSTAIRISHPAEDEITNNLLNQANFRLDRTLAIMGIDLIGRNH